MTRAFVSMALGLLMLVGCASNESKRPGSAHPGGADGATSSGGGGASSGDATAASEPLCNGDPGVRLALYLPSSEPFGPLHYPGLGPFAVLFVLGDCTYFAHHSEAHNGALATGVLTETQQRQITNGTDWDRLSALDRIDCGPSEWIGLRTSRFDCACCTYPRELIPSIAAAGEPVSGAWPVELAAKPEAPPVGVTSLPWPLVDVPLAEVAEESVTGVRVVSDPAAIAVLRQLRLDSEGPLLHVSDADVDYTVAIHDQLPAELREW